MNQPTEDPEGSPEERELLRCIQRVHSYAFSTKSDYSRQFADQLAEAACKGFVTTRVVPGQDTYGRHWKVTPLGLLHLEHWAHLIGQEEVQNYEDHETED